MESHAPLPLEEKLAASWPPAAWQELTLLVAVSGGADSVALLRALTAVQGGGSGRIHAAHFNHHLRAAESDADQAFVVELCHGLGIACEVGHTAGSLAEVPGTGLEEAARAARYDFFRQAAERLGARYLATAHTADDQAETILHRVIRGTGVAGLAGIARVRSLGPAVSLIRPLLGVRRGEVLAYLEELRQPYRRDSSNDDRRFTRNRLRRELLPQLAAEYHPGVVEALLRLGTLAGEVQAVVDARVEELAERCVAVDAQGVSVDRSQLAAEPRYLVRELLLAVWRRQGWPLQAMGFAQWEQLAEMALAGGGPAAVAPWKRTFPGGVTARAGDGQLRLERPAATPARGTPPSACRP